MVKWSATIYDLDYAAEIHKMRDCVLGEFKCDFQAQELVFGVLKSYNENTVLGNQVIAQPESITKKMPVGKYKLNANQINAMWKLSQEKSMTVSELADVFSVQRQNMSKDIIELFKLGLVNRFQKEDNLKNVYVELSEHGRKVFDESKAIKDSFFLTKFMSALTQDEMKELIQIYQRLKELLEKLR